MPAKRSTRQQTPAKKEKPAAAPEETKRSRSRRGASPTPPPAKTGTKRKASPSPAPAKTPSKRGRAESESPAPTKRQSARGASAASKKETPKPAAKTNARSASKGEQTKGRVTRNVVEKVETKKAASSRGRSTSQKATPQKKDTPKRGATPKNASASPKKKPAPPQKAPARGRSATPKSKQKAPSTPKQKVTPKQKSTHKQKETPKRSATPKQKAATPKPKATPKAKTPAKSPAVKKSPAKSPRSKTPVKKDIAKAKSKSPKEADEKIKESRVEISKETKAKADEAVEADTATAVEQENEEEMKENTNVETETTEEKEADDEAVAEEKDELKQSVEKENTEEEEEVQETSQDMVESEESPEAMEDESEETPEAIKDESEKISDIAEDEIEESPEAVQDEPTEPLEDATGESPEAVEEEEEESPEAIEAKSEKSPEADKDESEESPEAVKDETAEDENVEEDQEVQAENDEIEDNIVETAAAEEKDEDDMDDQIIEQSNQVEKEEDAIEQQAESEQIESDGKEECESAESEQVEADVSAQDIVDSTNKISENAEPIEVNSDVSSTNDDKVIEINEDSGEAMIIEDEIREESASGNAGAGDSKWASQSEKPETEIEEDEYDIQEVGSSPAPVIEVQEEEEAVNDVSSTGIEEAEDAIQIVEPESLGNSQVSNGARDGSPPRKRKLDDIEDTEEIVSKKVKTVDESKIENGSLSHESDVTADYVVVNMNEIPAADSEEIKNSLPVAPALQQQQSGSVDQNPVFSRVFIPNSGYTTSGDTSKQFSIVSYNVLADCHLFRNDYSFTEAKYLAPEYRLTNLIKELEYLNGDVVCLQEVDPDFYNSTLLPKMQSLGYEGLHKKRTTEYFNEGEATFYKLSRFSLVDYSTPRLADLVEKELVDSIDPAVRDAVRSYLDLPDVLIVTKLKCSNTGAEVTIGNIHVAWGQMKIPDAQCVQIASAIKEVVSKAGVDNLPHLICGDFNSPPNSAGYLVARDGYPTGDETVTKLQEINAINLPSGQPASLVNSLWPAFQHTSSLRSAYNEVEGSEPKISSYNKVMKDTVDYVFYSSSCLDNVGVLRTADSISVTGTGGIPNQYFPSDHVSLKAVLSFK